MRRVLALALGLAFGAQAAVVHAELTITNTHHYDTATQMLLANEINESGEPYAEALGYDLDVLDPMQPGFPDETAYALGIENYEYSRYQLGVVIARSGLGLHMMWSPIIVAQAAMETDPDFDGSFTGGQPNGYNEDDELMKAIMHFSMLANQSPPMHPWPQFGEFVAGDPHYAQPVDADAFAHDFATLRWDRSLMTKQLGPGAMGQALMKQYLWAQDMLGAFHDTNGDEVTPDGSVSPDFADGHFDPDNGIFYGGDPLDGFVGQVLTAESINKVKNLIDNLAFDGQSLGGVDPMSYDPANGLRYFPHRIAVAEEPVDGLPPRAGEYTVVDPRSELFDQASLLWGAVNFANMMNPDDDSDEAHLAYHAVFDGDPFPAPMSETGQPGPYDLMKGTAKVVFQNLMAMHYDPNTGSFVDFGGPAGHGDGDDDRPWHHGFHRGRRASTLNVAYVLVALDAFQAEFDGTPLADAARAAIRSQADALLASRRGHQNLYRERIRLGHHGAVQTGARSLLAQAAAVRGLYAAFDALGDASYRDDADAAYADLSNTYYREQQGVFATRPGSHRAVYDPQVSAVLSGALRDARLLGGHEDATTSYIAFWNNVANKMQLAEGPNTGETGGDSDGDGIPFIPEQPEGLAPVFAPRARLILSGHGHGDDHDALGNSETSVNPVSVTNFPNPFNPSTVIAFELSETARVSLVVYDIRGRAVDELANGTLSAGRHELVFHGDRLASGVYYYVMDVNDARQVGKMTLLK